MIPARPKRPTILILLGAVNIGEADAGLLVLNIVYCFVGEHESLRAL